MIGQTIDKYRLEDEIGQGGMAIVYRAHDTKLRRDVAIKLLLPHLLRQPEAVGRFRREAVTVARLSHPNIIDIYDYSGEHSAQPYIVTELIDGQTLGRFVEGKGPLPCELAACVGREIAQALVHAHEQSVVHRDLKPENIMIRRDGKIKLMDFGIARVLESATLTLTGSIMGSPAFMSPEHITGRSVEAASDLFSLGSILYFLVAGSPPFMGQNPHEILKRVVDGDREPLQMRAPACSNRFAALVDKLLSRDPALRPAGAAAVLQELDRILAEGGIGAPAEELNHYFSDPKGYGEQFTLRLVHHLEQQAQSQTRRKPAQAMQTYSRILAMNPGHPVAATQLERLIRRQRSLARSRVELMVGGALILTALLVAWLLGLHDPADMLPEMLVPLPPENVASFPPEVAQAEAPREESGRDPARATANGEGTRHVEGQARPLNPSRPPTRTENLPRPPAQEAVVPSGSLRVVALPWADVYVNGRKVGSSPHTEPFALTPGRNEIRLENPSYRTYSRAIDVTRADQREFIRHRMERLPGLLRLDNSQQAMVFIDGDFVGYTPLKAPIEVRLGEQENERQVLVSLTKAGFQPFNTRMTVRAGRTESLEVTLQAKEGGP